MTILQSALEEQIREVDMLLEGKQVKTALAALEYDLDASERERQALFDGSGVPLRSEGEVLAVSGATGRKENEARDRFSARIRAIADPVVAGTAKAMAELRQAESVDPLESLSASDLARANALSPFVRETSETMGVKGLIERLRSAAAGDDRVTASLYLRYSRERLEKESAGLEQSPLDPDWHALAGAVEALEVVALGKAEVESRKKLRNAIARGESILGRLSEVRLAFDGRQLRDRFGLGDPPPRLLVYPRPRG